MNSESEMKAWERTAALRRTRIAGMPQDAPFGFATRVVARWQELRRNELVRAWERLSIRTALVCAACAVLFGLYSLIGSGAAEEELLEIPSLTIDTGITEF